LVFRKWVINISILIGLFVFFSALQTSLWPLYFSGVPSPQFWLIFCTYFMLYRQRNHAFLMVYGLGFLVLSFSGIPMKMIFPILFTILVVGTYVRARFFWPNLKYFVVATAATVISYEVLFLILSHFLEEVPATIQIVNRASHVILTAAVAPFFYELLCLVDRMSIGDLNYSIEDASL
jgi:hypothetical protein